MTAVFAFLGAGAAIGAVVYRVAQFLQQRREEREWRELQRRIDEGAERWWKR